MRALRSFARICSVLAILGIAPACTDGGTDSAVTPESVPVDDGFRTDIDEGSVRIETDEDGTRLDFDGIEPDTDADVLVTDEGVSVGADDDFQLSEGPPEGWPTAFPAPDLAEVEQGSVLISGTETLRTLTYRVAMSPEDLLAFYAIALADAQPVATHSSEDPLRFHATVSFDGSMGRGFLTVSTEGTDTSLAVHLTERAGPGAP